MSGVRVGLSLVVGVLLVLVGLATLLFTYDMHAANRLGSNAPITTATVTGVLAIPGWETYSVHLPGAPAGQDRRVRVLPVPGRELTVGVIADVRYEHHDTTVARFDDRTAEVPARFWLAGAAVSIVGVALSALAIRGSLGLVMPPGGDAARLSVDRTVVRHGG